MATLVVVLIILFALGILGAVIKGLLWLTVVAAVLFVLGAVFGGLKLRGGPGD